MLIAGCGGAKPSAAGSTGTATGSTGTATGNTDAATGNTDAATGNASATTEISGSATGNTSSATSDSGTKGGNPGAATSNAGTTAASAGSSSAPSESSPAEAGSTPAPEASGPESPQPSRQGGPTITVASLPIGGDTSADGARQCGQVSLTLQGGLPPGVSVSVDDISLGKQSIFTLGGDGCSSDLPACTTGWTWTTDTAGNQCAVAVTQTAEGTEEPVKLILAGTVKCPDQGACDQVRNVFGDTGSQIAFTPVPGAVSGTSTQSPSTQDSGGTPTETTAATSPATATSSSGG